MKYGLIGEHLTHSFSKVIHEQIGDYVYEIKEIEPQNVDAFMKQRDFCAINVTIPYKETVIPYLDYIDNSAKKIGAVNTVVNKNGKLYGYNTDYSGMMWLINKIGLNIKDKKVLIIGTGGTSKTATAVISDMGAKEIIYAYKSKTDSACSYDEIYKHHTDTEIIFNTSPVGMYPKAGASPLDEGQIDLFKCVYDIVYNPSETELLRIAKEKGKVCGGGLSMLVCQAMRAQTHWYGAEFTREETALVIERSAKELEATF
jgi:shikimate dehydrogenase